jgi:acid phosphatase family membrane protein YuiD
LGTFFKPYVESISETDFEPEGLIVVMSNRILSLRAFFENPVFLASVSSWFFAQLVKSVTVLLNPRKKSIREVLIALTWQTGGMPSSHAALVSAMTTSVAFKDGLGSDLFIVSVWISLIVMRDAMGVRRASGVQGHTLNLFGRIVAEKLGIEFHPVKEIRGHEPLEVVAGGLLGIFIAAAYAYL